MRRTIRVLALMGVVAALGPAAALAQDGGTQPPRRRGRVERTSPMTNLTKRYLERYDRNGNGQVDAEERSAMSREIQERMKTQRGRIYERYDTNRDGTLDRAEEDRMRESWQRLKASRGRGLERFDLDRDGQLSDEERAKFHELRDAWLKRIRESVLARHDLNRNGRLDPEEKAALRAAAPSR